MKVKISYDPDFLGMKVWLYEDNGSSLIVAEPVNLVMREVELTREIEPTFTFNKQKGHEFLQSLVNALVEVGFKPDEIKAHNKEIEAIKNHLEDMRKLVFNDK